jgi:hypothetical protein
VLVVPQWLVRWELGAQARTLAAADRAKAINDVRATLLQGIGGAVLLLGDYFTYRQLQTGRQQLQIAQQGQVTHRFTRAIDQLGHTELDVRLGGIDALERIANDSPDDRATIVEVLTAFVRGHAPWPPRLENQPPADAPIEQVPELQVRAPDVQAALTVLARRQAPPKPSAPPDLHATDLRKADLHGYNLQRVRLYDANLQGASLCDANFQGHSSSASTFRGRTLSASISKGRASPTPTSRARSSMAQISGGWACKGPTSGGTSFLAPTFTGRVSTMLRSRRRTFSASGSLVPAPTRIPPGPKASILVAPIFR